MVFMCPDVQSKVLLAHSYYIVVSHCSVVSAAQIIQAMAVALVCCYVPGASMCTQAN